jgi:hypothetical protein
MKRPWFIIIALCLLIFGAIGIFVAQLFLPGPGVVVGKSTTHLTTPLAADGLPDYAAYLLEQSSQGVTPENNGAIPYLQAMWPAELAPEHRLAICKHLGMAVPAAEGMGYPTEDDTFKEALLAWLEKKFPPQEREGAEGGEGEELVWDDEYGTKPTPDERMWEVLGHTEDHPWKRADLPLLAQWIDDHAEHYDLLHEAARRPKFHLPPPELLMEPEAPLLAVTLSTVQALRTTSNCLTMRANLHLGEEDTAAAWKDCEAMYRLTSHSSFDSLVNELVNIAVTGVADALVLDILESEHLTPEVAQQIHAFQQSRTPRKGMVDALDNGERLMFVTTILELSGERGDGTATVGSLLGDDDMPPLEKVSVNWNIVLEKANACYDRIVEASRMEDWAARRAAQQQVEAEFIASTEDMAKKIPAAIFSRTARSEAMGDMLLALFIPALQAASHAEDRSNAHLQLQQVAAALVVYRLEQGAYPEKLDELVPGLLEALPIDLYGQPLVYRRTEQGYLVYSLGPNGTDDRGSNEMMSAYQGYNVYGDEEAAVRTLLGLPALKEQDPNAIGEFAGDELNDSANFPLAEQIPAGADDWSLRLPLPKVDFPLESPGEQKEE